MLKHMGVMVFECDFRYCGFDVCEAVFRNEHGLREHKRRHTDQNPFVCSFEGCGFVSACWIDLVRHRWQCDFRRQMPDVSDCENQSGEPAEIEVSNGQRSPKSSRLDAEAADALLATLNKDVS